MSDLFVELFSFLSVEQRADVLKMAATGVAQMSKDNAELFAFFSAESNMQHSAKLCALVDPRLPAAVVPVLGDVLLAIVNVSVDAGCCATLVKRGVPLKLLKLFETLVAKGDELTSKTSPSVLSELSLMALNNLTATSVAACDQVLELHDEDLAGYQLGRLKTHYDRSDEIGASVPDVSEKKTEEKHGNDDDDDDDDEDKKKKDADGGRKNQSASLRKWVLQIVLNISRVKDGARLFLEDEDWRTVPAELITHTHLFVRALAMQLVRNLANFRNLHGTLVDDVKIVKHVMHALCVGPENDLTVLHGWTDVVVALIGSEDGMRGMDEQNAKQMLAPVIRQSQRKHEEDEGTSGAVVLAASGDNSASAERSVAVPWEVAKRLQEEVMPFLDDIQDVHLMGGDDDS